MSRFLLVPGTAHGAWAFRDLIPALAALGHDAQALDLPSVGASPEAVSGATLEGDARAILCALDAPTIVLGHSSAGFAITAAAMEDPRQIARLIYLCAYVPRPGMSLLEMRKDNGPDALGDAFEGAPGAFRFRPEAVAANLMGDCAPEAQAFARARIGWQSLATQRTRLDEVAVPVPRSYILCDADRTIPPTSQARMAAGFAPEDLHHFPTGHAPYFADPTGLAALLDRISAAAPPSA